LVISDWLLSWNAFLDWLGEQYSLRKEDAEIALAVSGRSVQWSGRVVHLKLDSKYVPGIEFDMGSHRVELGDGNHIDRIMSEHKGW
jgi:hypothetical protein